MLTPEEQLVFVKEQCHLQIKLLELLGEQLGKQNEALILQQIDHNNFCYKSVIASLQELKDLKRK